MRRFAAVAGRAPAGDPAPAARRLWPARRAAEPRARARWCPRAFARASTGARTRRTRGRSSSCPATATALAVRARASSRCSRAAAPARCRSRSAATPTGQHRSCTRSARSDRPRRRSAPPSRATCSASAARSAGAWPVDERRGRRRRGRRRRHRPRAAAAGDPPAARAPRALRPPDAALRRRGRPTSCSTPTSCEAWAARGLDVVVTVDSAGPEWLGHVGVVTRARAPRRARPGQRRSRCSAGRRS